MFANYYNNPGTKESLDATATISGKRLITGSIVILVNAPPELFRLVDGGGGGAASAAAPAHAEDSRTNNNKN